MGHAPSTQAVMATADKKIKKAGVMPFSHMECDAAAYVVSGAGSPQFNGTYTRFGSFRGLPRYRHTTATPPLFLRQGGSANSGYGLLRGATTFPTAWAYFCEASRDMPNLRVVPSSGWVCHGGQAAHGPAPIVQAVTDGWCGGSGGEWRW